MKETQMKCEWIFLLPFSLRQLGQERMALLRPLSNVLFAAPAGIQTPKCHTSYIAVATCVWCVGLRMNLDMNHRESECERIR
eukprot:5777642-Pyramimonas_sp.AAC.1